jgi:cell wall-associated NlpC family hydrolase
MPHPRAADILAEARTWLGVRYMWLGRDRQGIDCVGLPLCVGKNVGLTTFDSRAYGRDPQPRQLVEGLAKAGFTFVRAIEPGDLALLKVHNQPRHCGIVEHDATGRIFLLHAWEPAGKVIREPYYPERYGRLSLAYRFPGG